MAQNIPQIENRKGRTRAIVRGEVEALLRSIRVSRAAAQRDDALQLDRLAAVLPIARASGLSLEAIAELSGVSRPTMNRMPESSRLHVADAELGVLAAIAVGGPQTPEQAIGHARSLGMGQERDTEVAVQLLSDKGQITTGMMAGSGGNLDPYLILTPAGEEALKTRIRYAGIGSEFRWAVFFAVKGSAAHALADAAEAKLGTGEVALLTPGVAANQDFEIAFPVRAAAREEALQAGRHQFKEICDAAGVQPNEVAIQVLALEP